MTQHGDMNVSKVSKEGFFGSTYTKTGKVLTTAAALRSTSLVLD